MITALKTSKWIKIAIDEARVGGEEGLGEFLRSMYFFGSICMFYRSLSLACILQPLPVLRKLFVWNLH